MGRSLKLLIAPWGNPKGYDKVKYIINGYEGISRTSLEILKNYIKPDECYILVSDTLGVDDNLSGINNSKDFYSQLRKNIEEIVKDLIEDCKISILYGTGKFKAERNSKYIFDFKSKTTDYYYSLLYNLIFDILNSEKLKDIDNLEVHLDISHGINFMPVFSYRAIKDVLEILDMFLKEVKLIVYNSDPYIRNTTDELKINIVEENIIRGKPYDRKMIADKGKYFYLYKSINDNESYQCFEDISQFIGAVFNGLPLAIYTFFPDIEKLETSIKCSVENYENSIRITKENNTININKGIFFTDNFKAYLIAYLMAKLFKLKNLIEYRKNSISYSEIKEINKRFYKNFDERVFLKIANELFNLKRFKNKATTEWQLLKYLETYNRELLCKNPNSRNFLAHSGFEYYLTEVRKNNHILEFRYRKNMPNCDINFEETIKNFVIKGLL